MPKVIKLTLTDAEFEQFDLHARKNNHANVQKLATFLMKQDSSGSKLVSRSAAPTIKPSPNFSAAFIKQFMIQPDAHERVTKGKDKGEVQDGGKRKPLDYAIRDDRAYPLFKQLGARLPSLDFDEAFWIPLNRVKGKNGWIDISSQLSELENRWLDLWKDHFSVMDGLWVFMKSRLEQDDEPFKLHHYVEIIKWYDDGQTAEKLNAEKWKGLAKKSFAERRRELFLRSV